MRRFSFIVCEEMGERVPAFRSPFPLYEICQIRNHDILTGAGRLPFEGIIHVAGINMLWCASERSIRGSVQSAMDIVDQHGYMSVAFPIIGAGSGRFDTDKALEIMLDEFLEIKSGSVATIVKYRKT